MLIILILFVLYLMRCIVVLKTVLKSIEKIIFLIKNYIIYKLNYVKNIFL